MIVEMCLFIVVFPYSINDRSSLSLSRIYSNLLILPLFSSSLHITDKEVLEEGESPRLCSCHC